VAYDINIRIIGRYAYLSKWGNMGTTEYEPGNHRDEKRGLFSDALYDSLKSTDVNTSDDKLSGSDVMENESLIQPERCGFGKKVVLPRAIVERIDLGLAKVSELLLEKSHESYLFHDSAHALDHVREELRRSALDDEGGIIITHDAALDLTTGLLDLADVLFGMSCVVEALALEGIESHILEVMVTPWSKNK